MDVLYDSLRTRTFRSVPDLQSSAALGMAGEEGHKGICRRAKTLSSSLNPAHFLPTLDPRLPPKAKQDSLPAPDRHILTRKLLIRYLGGGWGEGEEDRTPRPLFSFPSYFVRCSSLLLG